MVIEWTFSKYRYAIGKAERPMLKSKIGWLDILANDTHEYYYPNNTGGPSIKVSVFCLASSYLSHDLHNPSDQSIPYNHEALPSTNKLE